jgi:hypothetical protein
MTVQGMIFSTPMVQALWDGRKVQTRRLLPEGKTPRLQVGDRVYVRETFRISPDACEGWPHEAEPCPGWIEYVAGGSHYCFAPDYMAVLQAFGRKAIVDWDALPQRWRPARYAPRWTSRMFLTITDMREQQLQDISEEDAQAEGIYQTSLGLGRAWCIDRPGSPAKGGATIVRPAGWEKARHAYVHLWDRLNTARGSRWQDNPSVVAYTFTVTRRNIDVLPVPAARPSARDLIEGKVAPQLAGQLIRARDLPQPQRSAANG